MVTHRPLCWRTGKIGYGSREHAVRKLERNQRRFRPAQQRVYECEFCERWHVTSQLPRGS